MISRTAEIVLVLAAAALFIWGVVRAVDRGEGAVHAWTTYVMVGLLVLTTANIQIRSRRIAVPITWVCGLLALIVMLEAILGASEGNPYKSATVLRALLFFVCVGTASFIQFKLSQSPNRAG